MYSSYFRNIIATADEPKDAIEIAAEIVVLICSSFNSLEHFADLSIESASDVILFTTKEGKDGLRSPLASSAIRKKFGLIGRLHHVSSTRGINALRATLRRCAQKKPAASLTIIYQVFDQRTVYDLSVWSIEHLRLPTVEILAWARKELFTPSNRQEIDKRSESPIKFHLAFLSDPDDGGASSTLLCVVPGLRIHEAVDSVRNRSVDELLFICSRELEVEKALDAQTVDKLTLDVTARDGEIIWLKNGEPGQAIPRLRSMIDAQDKAITILLFEGDSFFPWVIMLKLGRQSQKTAMPFRVEFPELEGSMTEWTDEKLVRFRIYDMSKSLTQKVMSERGV